MKGFPANKMGEVFNEVYRTSFWSHADGSGSDSRPETVPEFLLLFKDLLKSYRIKSIADLGCGSHYIFKDFEWPENIHYTGYDASDIALTRAEKNCNRGDFVFRQEADFNNIENNVDLLLVKDVMCHWTKEISIDFVNAVIPKFKNTLIVGNPKINMFDEISSYKKEWLFKNSKGQEYGMWLY